MSDPREQDSVRDGGSLNGPSRLGASPARDTGGEIAHPDFEWAYERVVRMCASAMVDAQVYRQKLLKGFGYPNEVFRAAQDYRALYILLAALSRERSALDAMTKTANFFERKAEAERSARQQVEQELQELKRLASGRTDDA